MSLSQRTFNGPYRCWKCKALFTLRIEGKEIKSLDPLSEEEFQKRQQIEAQKKEKSPYD